MEKLNDYIKQLKGGYDPEYFPNNNDKIKIDEVVYCGIGERVLGKLRMCLENMAQVGCACVTMARVYRD